MMDVRTYRGENVDSGHYLVITRIRAKISWSNYIPNKEKIRYNISNLKGTEYKKEYEKKIKDLCQGVEEGETAAEEWANLETINSCRRNYWHSKKINQEWMV
jgi:formiminotetrahydrofolate cyclodeaminase